MNNTQNLSMFENVTKYICQFGMSYVLFGCVWYAIKSWRDSSNGSNDSNDSNDSFVFVMSHMFLVYLYLVKKQYSNFPKTLLWFVLTIAHGYAHIAHPSFLPVMNNISKINPDYTPFYDYVVHAAQCLMVWYYHEKLGPIGTFGAMVMMVSSAMAHLDKSQMLRPDSYVSDNDGNMVFPVSYFWLFASGWGVFGTIYHMMLLSESKNNALFIANVIIWSIPYIGYVVPNNIPEWDTTVTRYGLFVKWFGAYGLANILFYDIN